MKKRILFFDDEPNILQGLKRLLRSQRHEWDMQFSEGGEQALEMLEQEPFDAIISDMKMPGMDGAQLLDEVKDRHPEMVRFILSGYSDQELVMRSVGSSHQYMAKPCEFELLKTNLADAFTLRELLTSEALRTVVTGMDSLPSLPNIYCEVIEELQSPNASIKVVGGIVEQDPGMSIKILQLVNSAYFGINRHISNPAEAVNFLGVDVIKSLMLSEGIFSQFDPAAIKALSLDSMKNRCLQVAQAACSIAKAEGADKKIVDQAFLAGLLYDIGTIVLASNVPEDFIRARDLVKTEGIDLYSAEKQVFGTTHAEVGAYLLGLWGIDDDVVAAVAYHHRPGAYPTPKFSALTAVFIATSYIIEKPPSKEQQLISEEGLAYLEHLGLADRLPEWQTICKPLEEDAA
ncbi:MAG: two-component system response regulator [Thiotrichaceae bacterium]|nr:MAG: two-component system response regulator [Thiotrichaceae bacterium]